MKSFQWIAPVTDKVRASRLKAINEAGGVTHVARTLGVSRPVIERLLNGDSRPGRSGSNLDPRIARGIIALCDGKVTLKQIAPETFKGLTVKELGYTPKPE